MGAKRRVQTLESLAYHQAEMGRWAGAGRVVEVVVEELVDGFELGALMGRWEA